jgi:hypothetical protein
MERQIRKVQQQYEREAKVAYSHMSKWLQNGRNFVPTWMNGNKHFKSDLANIMNGQQYLMMLKKYGRQFVLNPEQCKFLLQSENERPQKIQRIIKVIL